MIKIDEVWSLITEKLAEKKENGHLYLDMDWRVNSLDDLLPFYKRTLSAQADVRRIVFKNGESPIKRCKPFRILQVSLIEYGTGHAWVFAVKGERSKRIEERWERELTEQCLLPALLIWKQEIAGCQCQQDRIGVGG